MVDDELLIQLSLIRLLQRLGYEVVATASSGQEAVEQARECRPEVILLEVRLAGKVDGIEAARQIRKISGAPLIFATASTAALEQDWSQRPGVYRSVAKPFSPSQLQTVIEKVRPRRAE